MEEVVWLGYIGWWNGGKVIGGYKADGDVKEEGKQGKEF